MKKISKLLAFIVASLFSNNIELNAKDSRVNSEHEIDIRILNIREAIKEDLKDKEATKSKIDFPTFTLNSNWINWGNWGNWNNWNNWVKWNDWRNWNNWNDFSNWQKFSNF
ncbi:hypothetical protein [Cyclobacterium amurskyense]|uniref:Uncharacterized protein n=1 Tax=Cyclobacterium amurskyense TaxID=320787 RepID=A0A0H4PEM3_9BACT|nr:hypothetical protein [Cyclobacterium amurskyense]AKP51545.1 hypothetical protein CA2015_2123 [Cyclobacterium amurskyense]